jgi:hypothetical protein
MSSVRLVTPHITGGSRACPPEDCGGPCGYADLLKILADPRRRDRAALLEWVGGSFDAEEFDAQSVNAALELYDRHTRRRHRRA